MNLVAPSGARVYNISAGKSLPKWISEKKRKALKRDVDFQRRIELLQDFEFNTACHRVRVSGDGTFVAATGVYPPQVKMFEVDQLALKFERHLDCEVVDFDFLSGDYKKLVFLEADRTVEVHAQWGSYFKTRIPAFGRCMQYDAATADLYLGASGSDLYRLNLSLGRFQTPLKTTSEAGVNCLAQHAGLQLVAAGCENGVVECFDPRAGQRAALLDVKAQLVAGQAKASSMMRTGGGFAAVTAVALEGLQLGVGTQPGVVLLYDLRSSKPLLLKDHQYDMPIKDLHFHGEHVISCDAKICKIWEREGGAAYANIELESDINSVCVVPKSGLLFLAAEQERVESYYVPGLGPAPSWCSFLDNLTEELEEEAPVIYDDYKFVTRKELEELGLENMVGTAYLRAYMHGFFMDMRLYRKVRAVANPQSYKEYVKEKIKKKREERQASRITKPKKNVSKLNKQMAERFLVDQKKARAREAAGAEEEAAMAGLDPRFAALVNSSDFNIDESTPEFEEMRRRMGGAIGEEEDGQEGAESGQGGRTERKRPDRREKRGDKGGDREKKRKPKSGLEAAILERRQKAAVPLRDRVKELRGAKRVKKQVGSRSGNKQLTFVPKPVKKGRRGADDDDLR